MKKLLLLLTLAFSLPSSAQTLEDDRLALIEIYNANGGVDWFKKLQPLSNALWVVPGQPGDSPCGWQGISCNAGRVTALYATDLIGTLSPAIGKLTALTTLVFTDSDKKLSTQVGGRLPDEIGNLVSLKVLNLSGTHFTENVDVICKLSKLTQLSLPVFSPLSAAIGKLSELKNLSMVYPKGYATAHTIGGIPKEIGKLTKLEYLEIANIRFEGPIPKEIGNLTSLKSLAISELTNGGPIPASIGKLRNLERLMLSNNGHTGSIPAIFGSLPKLANLYLAANQLSGPVPDLSAISVNAAVFIEGNQFSFIRIPQNTVVPDKHSAQQQFNLLVTMPRSDTSGSAGVLQVPEDLRHTDNTYHWYKDNVLQSSDQSPEFKYFDTLASSSIYRVEITNSSDDQSRLYSFDYTAAPLPVKIVSFTGQESESANLLTWQTALGINKAGFAIERSRDGSTFEKIGFVEANGNTKESSTYHYTDQNPFAITHYRLKLLDMADKFKYSSIISVRNTGRSISVYPNPANAVVSVSGTVSKDQVVIYHINGMEAARRTLSSEKTFDVSGLPAGLYTLMIGDATKKLLIQK